MSATYAQLKSGKKTSSKSSSGTYSYDSLKKAVSPNIEKTKTLLAQRDAAQREVDIANERATAMRKAVDEYNAKISGGGIVNNLVSGVKSFFGKAPVLDEIPGAPNTYQSMRNAQLAQNEAMGPGNYLGRAGNTIASAADGSSKYLQKLTIDAVLRPQDLKTGAGKNLAELGSGVLKLGASAVTGKLDRKIQGAIFGNDYAKRNTTEFQRKTDSFIDSNGILNYKAQYANEAQKTGGDIAELGSWFIPITRTGKVEKLERALAEIPKVVEFLGTKPKLIVSGGKLFYEVAKDVIDVGTLNYIRGKDWETIKKDSELVGIGGTVLRAGGKVLSNAIENSNIKKALITLDKSLGSLTDEEIKIATDGLKSGKALDEIHSILATERNLANKEITPQLEETVAPVAKVPVEVAPPKVFTAATIDKIPALQKQESATVGITNYAGDRNPEIKALVDAGKTKEALALGRTTIQEHFADLPDVKIVKLVDTEGGYFTKPIKNAADLKAGQEPSFDMQIQYPASQKKAVLARLASLGDKPNFDQDSILLSVRALKKSTEAQPGVLFEFDKKLTNSEKSAILTIAADHGVSGHTFTNGGKAVRFINVTEFGGDKKAFVTNVRKLIKTLHDNPKYKVVKARNLSVANTVLDRSNYGKHKASYKPSATRGTPAPVRRGGSPDAKGRDGRGSGDVLQKETSAGSSAKEVKPQFGAEQGTTISKPYKEFNKALDEANIESGFGYKKETNVGQIDAAKKIIEEGEDNAYRVAFKYKDEPGVLNSVTNIVMEKSARESGNETLANMLKLNRLRQQTRNAKELQAENIALEGTANKYLRRLISDKMIQIIGKSESAIVNLLKFGKKSGSELLDAVVKDEAVKIEKAIMVKKLDMTSAQKVLDNLIC